MLLTPISSDTKITRPTGRQTWPADAKPVFHGNIFSIYQWPQKMYDDSVKTFERLKRNDTVGILPVTNEGKIIITKQEQPGLAEFHGQVGGVIDDGEDVFEAANRELLEESGYVSNEWYLFNTVCPSDRIDWVVYTLVAKNCTKIAEQNLDGGEKIELLYLNLDELMVLMLDDAKWRDRETALALLRLKEDKEKWEEFRGFIHE